MGRAAAHVVFALILFATQASAVAAADPLSGGPFSRPDRSSRERVPSDERPLVAGTMSVQAAPGMNGNIVYSRAPFGGWPAATWVMNGDGSGQALLKPGGAGEGDNLAAWSPGGTLIAFTRDNTSSTTDLAGDIYVMREDGTQVRRLTATAAAEYSPSWSPDGSRLAFASNRSGNFEIYTMNIDGTDVRRITTNPAHDLAPTWSPDGTRIAFHSFRSGNGDIYTMSPSGSNVSRITSSAAQDLVPNWSPDGSKIAFSSDRTNAQFDVFTMTATGAAVTNITNTPESHDLNPTWSPDGSLIVYDGDPFGDLDVLVVSSSGGPSELIAFEFDDEWSPDWQPIPDFPLVDARFSPFDPDIQWLFNAGISTGCSTERYCPKDAVNREQMASFLARALNLPATSSDFFSDDETSIHEADINKVAAAGITTGCGPNAYCPKAVVTREQMASFLARALNLPATSSDFFSDDETSIHEADINKVAAAGITTGCGPNAYCPKSVVTREQMAAFLHRAFDN